MGRKYSLVLLVGSGLLGLAAAAPAQVPQTPVAPQGSAPKSMLDQAPTAPVIRYDAGKLTIEATNSSLRAILDRLQSSTGTHIQGLNQDERIFGVYGPGNPQEVLAALLDDSGYNVLISGRTANGAPREIVLSTRSSAPSASTAPAARSQSADEEDDTDTADTPPPQPALFTQPQQPPPVPANGQQQIKTPQQMLEELQRMRQNAAPQTGAPQQ